MKLTRRSALGMIGGAAAAAVLPSPVLGALTGAPVQLVDGGDTVTLSNGLISATIRKATAEITALYLIGSRHGNQLFNLVSGLNGHGYSTFDYYVATTRYSHGLSHAAYQVVAATPERAEVAMSANDPAVLPFAVEIHIALERGSPGLHLYTIFRYPSNMPDGLTIQQLRYAVAAGDPSFSYFVVDDARGIQQRPTIAEAQQWVTMQDTTYLLPDGRIWSKYQNITNLEGDNHVFMISNGRVGMAVIQAAKEWFAGGPTKQELTCHDYYNGMILLWHPFTSHYGSPDIAAPKGWEKIFGPFYLHVNEGSGLDATANVRQMWADAKRRAAKEQGRWPYRWVSDPLYALDSRSEVSGRLRIADDESAEGAWVVLSVPGQDWQYENLGYVYSGRAGEDGRFRLRAVRPGSYTLTAFVDGVVGELRREGVTVPASRHVDLGDLAWHPARHGRLLWQIGKPDRSAGEFHVFGGRDGFRKHLTWLEYPYEFPQGVDFKVGVDDPKERWNFFQPCFRTPGTPFQLQWRGTTTDHTLTTWTVRFDAEGAGEGVGTLEMALASSVFGTLRITLNGTEIASFDPLPGPPGDNGSYRLAERAMYRQLPPITFPATLIHEGENVITLAPVRPPKAPLTRGGTVDDWMEPVGGVMYDTIRLWVSEEGD